MQFLVPKNLTEALEQKKKNPDYHILAGGTDICVLMNGGFIKPEGIISIWGIDDLRGVKESGDSIEIGALTTHTEVTGSKIVRSFLPALAEACKTIGARQIQNRGTIGGNVMNASPAGDALPCLLAYEAEVKVASVNGERWIKFADFYKGYREAALLKDEIVVGFKVTKAPDGERSVFMKVGTRKAQAISKVMGCFRVLIDGEEIKNVVIAFGSVAPTPVRLPQTEQFLIGKKLTKDVLDKAGAAAIKEVKPIDDIRSTASYRSHICGTLLKRFLRSSACSIKF